MKTITIKLSTLLAVAAISVAAQNWELVWSDEFNYTGLPDPNKWVYDVGNGGWGNNELQNYTAARQENARVENGNLIIEARRDWHDGIEYSSTRLKSAGKGDWLYGRIEVKAKVPLGQGMWPAIWMLPTDWAYGGWPASGEIDIMENYALHGITPYTSEANIHTEAYNHMIGTNKGGKIETLSHVEENYHVYAVSWYADHMVFDVDGQEYFRFNNEGSWQTWPFDQRFHLILNIAVGGTLGTTPDPNIFPKRMTVDYVRVYRWDENSEYSVNITADAGGSVEVSPNNSSIKSGTEVTYKALANSGKKFDTWNGDLTGQPATTTMPIQKNMTAKAYFKDEKEMTINGKFKAGSSGWVHTMIDGATGTLHHPTNETHIQIDNAGTQFWSVSLAQTSSELKLVQGKTYSFSYVIRSDGNRTVTTGIGRNYDDYSTYISNTVDLTGSNKAYNHTFTMEEATDENVRIFFDCGLNTNDVWISGVSFKETEPVSNSSSKQQSSYLQDEIRLITKSKNLQFTGLSNENPIRASIYSINGKKLKSQIIETKTVSLNKKLFPSKGFYIIRISSSSISKDFTYLHK